MSGMRDQKKTTLKQQDKEKEEHDKDTENEGGKKKN